MLPRDADGTIADLGPFTYPQGLVSVPRVPVGVLACSVSPNPLRFNADARFSLGERSRVRVDILDLSGRIVRTLVDELREVGTHAVRWDGIDGAGRAVNPGLYYVRVHTRARSGTAPVVVIR